jgi:hypothetical protein
MQLLGLSLAFGAANIVMDNMIFPAFSGQPSDANQIYKVETDCAANPAGGSTLEIQGKTYAVVCPH